MTNQHWDVMVHIADTLFTHICPLPTSCTQKIPRDNFRDYHRSRATLSRQKRPSHSVWEEKGQGRKGGKLTTWKSCATPFICLDRWRSFLCLFVIKDRPSEVYFPDSDKEFREITKNMKIQQYNHVLPYKYNIWSSYSSEHPCNYATENK